MNLHTYLGNGKLQHAQITNFCGFGAVDPFWESQRLLPDPWQSANTLRENCRLCGRVCVLGWAWGGTQVAHDTCMAQEHSVDAKTGIAQRPVRA